MATRAKKGVGKELEADNKLAKAKVDFTMDNPFFATILLTLELREATEEDLRIMPVKTMGTDGESIIWCREFVDSLDLDELKAILAHEIMHVVSFHHLRRGQRDPIIWNMAGDYAINPVLHNAGFQIPDWTLQWHKFEEMETEVIYNHLMKMDKKSLKDMIDQFMKGKKQQNGEGQGCAGWVMDQKKEDGSKMSPAESKQAERRQKGLNEQAAIAHEKMCGTMPAFLQRLLGELRQHRVNWKEALAQFVEVNSKSDYDWLKPNRRYTKDDIYLPRAFKLDIGNIVNGIDVSGSVNEKEAREEVSELQGILWAYSGVTLWVSFFDTRSTEFQEVTDETDIKKLKIEGGGGTCYKDIFDRIKRENLEPVCIIILTDGYCDSFPKEQPEAPVLWVLCGSRNAHFKPPWGEVLVMDNSVEDND